MYNRLLLSTGGGIISNQQKDEQEDCVTIAIGLGGTGVACLRNLKRQVYDRLQADDPTAVAPSYSHIKFLAVDTDSSSLDADGKINSLDPTTEFFDISATNITALLNNTRNLKLRPELQWLQTADANNAEDGLTIWNATAGAGGVRQIGRLLIIQRSSLFVDRVAQMINEAKMGFPKGVDVNVHIFTGLGGGTGSGTFLDVCYLVQQALKNVGEYGHALTFGYFFLPDVNLSVPEVSANTAVSKYIKSNGFAAIKELDYYMNLETNGGTWDQQYVGFHVGPTSAPPVTCCHLVSAYSLNGAALAEGFGYSMNVVSDFIMQFVVKNDINMQSHIANYAMAMGMVSKDAGANYKYCLLGASNAIVPIKEIMTYLASYLFEQLADVSSNSPTNVEIEEFAKNNKLTKEGLESLILKGTSYSMPRLELDQRMFTQMSEQDLATPNEFVLPETIMTPYRNLQNKMVGIVETNSSALTHDWDRKRIQEEIDNISRVWRVYYALADLVEDSNRGPFYASVVLNGTGRNNLVDCLKGIKRSVQNQIEHLQNDVLLRIKEIKNARSAFLHPGVFANKKTLFDAFVGTVANYWTLDSHIKVLEKMETMIQTMVDQFINLYDECFAPYQIVVQKLIDTFHENFIALSNPGFADALQDPFIMPLLKMDDNMWDKLKDTVASLDLDQQKRNFFSSLFKKPDVWVNDDESKIAKYVSDYFSRVFNGYTQKTITNYLEMRFNTTNPQILQNKIFQEIMLPLSQMATPLFWKEPAFNAEQGKLGYISVPSNATVINSAAIRLTKQDPQLHLVNSQFANRVFLLRCTCGVPLFAYNGTDLYYQEYQNFRGKGKHIYEYTEGDHRDCNNFSNIKPYSKYQYHTEEMIADEALYQKAIKEGLIVKSETGNNYQLLSFAPLPDEIQKAAENAIRTHDIEEARKCSEEAQKYLDQREPEKKKLIPNDGMDKMEEVVRRDHVLSSREMISTIKEQLAILDNTRNLIKNLGEIRPDPTEDTFRNAMFTGVFTMTVNKIVYKKEKWGMTDETVLTDIRTEPYGKTLPLYQAYITFSNLSDGAKKEIHSQVDEKLANLEETGTEIRGVCDKLEAMFTGKYMGIMQSNAAKYPDEKSRIEQFFMQFMDELQNFKILNGLNLF